MLETPHAILGATIAAKIPNPLVALPLALLSHLLLDQIPHWNPDLGGEVRKYGHISSRSNLIILADVVLSLGFGFWIASQALPNLEKALVIILASFMAVVLDVIEGFHFFLGVDQPLLKRLISFQHKHQKRVLFLPGVLTQIAVILLSLYILRS